MTTARTLSITLAGIAALALGGCGPRQAPDASLRLAPASTPPIATVAVVIKPEKVSADSAGKAIVSFPMMILPVVSALTPSMGCDNAEAGSIRDAVEHELLATKVVSIASPEKADYLIDGEAESRWQTRMHYSGFGAVVWAVGILPAMLGAPHTTRSAEAEADIVVRRRVDGAKILSTSVSSDTSWSRGMWSGFEAADGYPGGVVRSVCVPEVGMTAAKRIALAIQADLATQSRSTPTTPTTAPAAAAPATAPAEAQ